MKIIFPKLNEVHIKEHLKKLRSFQLFSVDYTDNIDVLRLIKWIISKKLLYSVTNYYCDNKIVFFFFYVLHNFTFTT